MSEQKSDPVSPERPAPKPPQDPVQPPQTMDGGGDPPPEIPPGPDQDLDP